MLGILYFSSTGNSLYISQRVQSSLGGEIKYIPTYSGDCSEYQKIIIVTPIYSYGMPTFVYDLFPKLDKKVEIIVIQNYGGMVGGADYYLYQYATNNNLNIKAVFTVKMPENFTTTFTVPKFYIKSTLNKCDKYISAIINKISQGDYVLPKVKRTKEKEYLKNKENWHIIGERFSVNKNCIKCGKCVTVCPINNISFVNNEIKFANGCIACLGCYHRCPQKAITYMKKTKKDRYINPKINESDIGKDL